MVMNKKPSLSNMTNNNENVVRIIKVRAEWKKIDIVQISWD